MKNHIIFKFIAVLLCAASLLGAAGGILGITLLSSTGLYDVSVEEMVSMDASQDSADLADWLAKNYASTELGGAPEALVLNRYGNHWFTNKYDLAHYGYTISDAEGNELLSLHPELKERDDLYANERFPITGKYLHVVSLESQEDQERRQEAERAEILGEDVTLSENSVVPAEGAVVEQAIFVDADGQTLLEIWDEGACVRVIEYISEYGQEYTNDWAVPGSKPGFLFYSPEGNLVFHSAFDYNAYAGSLRKTEVYEAYFTFREGQVRLQQKEPVGQLYLSDNGSLMFLSQPLEPVTVEETIPETTEATVPETTAETLPPETVPEVTEAPVDPAAAEIAAAEEAAAAKEASSASAIPEEAPPEETWVEETQAPETVPDETVPAETVPVETEPAETVPEETIPEPVIIDGKPLDEYQINTLDYYDPDSGERIHAKFVYVPLPELTVDVYMTEDALRFGNGYEALSVLRSYRNFLVPAVAVCLLLFAIFGVYLCTAAGRKPGSEEVRAGGLNRLPLDLYLGAGGFGAACILVVGSQLAEQLLEQDFWTGCGLILAIGALSCLLAVGFCFAFVAQIKTPGGFWWRNTLCGQGVRLFMKFAVWFEGFLRQKFFPFCGKLLTVSWQYTMLSFVWLYKATEKFLLWLNAKGGHLSRWLWKLLHRFMKLLPVTWQWMVSGVVIIFCMMLVPSANDFMTVVLLLIPILIILYGAHCYGTLAESTRRMSKGDLNTKVDDKLLVGCFKDSAADLNALADVAVVAAQKQLKSERMKTELVTNVSHDIKTPLTSIINYVDLLRRPHTEEEGEQYLEVIHRHSQQLKKLIDDLMDMSKANTGNMQVEITDLDAVESINQALGEFSDKLDRAGLTPVFRHSEEHLRMQADGRLVWRVLSNLLGNAVKYAMPGTRLYIDLMELEGTIVISIKNVSREELRITAEELMARFVRGDESRNTEGSGLGLNIARSLMELQKGQLQLLVDGDLFKVTLIFPGAKE